MEWGVSDDGPEQPEEGAGGLTYYAGLGAQAEKWRLQEHPEVLQVYGGLGAMEQMAGICGQVCRGGEFLPPGQPK